jgi:hypothetical protein
MAGTSINATTWLVKSYRRNDREYRLVAEHCNDDAQLFEVKVAIRLALDLPDRHFVTCSLLETRNRRFKQRFIGKLDAHDREETIAVERPERLARDSCPAHAVYRQQRGEFVDKSLNPLRLFAVLLFRGKFCHLGGNHFFQNRLVRGQDPVQLGLQAIHDIVGNGFEGNENVWRVRRHILQQFTAGADRR